VVKYDTYQRGDHFFAEGYLLSISKHGDINVCGLSLYGINAVSNADIKNNAGFNAPLQITAT